MIKEPYHNFFDGFYIWFNEELKKEFYVTPLYLYQVKRKEEKNEYLLSLEKDISKAKPRNKEIVKCRADINKPYSERLGMFLINFINADFSSYESAYNTFFYAYGFELLADYGNFQTIFKTESELLTEIKNFYDRSLYKVKELQENYKSCVDFIYNLNGNEDLEEYKFNSKFTAYMIKNTDLYADSKDIDVVLDNFIDKHHKYGNESLETLTVKSENNDGSLKLIDIYTSQYLRCICFIVLKHLVKNDNTRIKQCNNCGRYFIPVNRQAEVYCDLPNVDGSNTCREKGAGTTYKNNLENVAGLLEYRRTYQKKLMETTRNKENLKLKQEFDNWKKKAQKKIKEFKQNKISEDELYNWMIENK